MTTSAPNDQVWQDALEGCAREPVHIPGSIQPFGALIACDKKNGCVRYMSENAPELFGRPVETLWAEHVRTLFGSGIWHAAQNFMSVGDAAMNRLFAGVWSCGEDEYAIFISDSGDYLTFEIDGAIETPKIEPEMVREQTFLVSQLQKCSDEATLFDLTTQLLRHFSGFDRVLIYKFDADWNGEVLSEARLGTLDPFLGLRFPHWDIPEQARAIMSKIQLRLITDTEQSPIPIHAQDDDIPELDLTFAQIRSVSPVHMQYLRNMGSRATMTLSVVLDGVLWGIISFHHGKPKIASTEIRQILTNGVLPIFCLKLQLLRQNAALNIRRRLESLSADIRTKLEEDMAISDLLQEVGPTICEELDIAGLAVMTGTETYSYGLTLEQPALAAIAERARDNDGATFSTESFATDFPDLPAPANGLAGALLIEKPEKRSLAIFRREIKDTISWAGNPEKETETVQGNLRLRPRGSFSTYLEDVLNRCKTWSSHDIYLASQLWPLFSVAERQTYMQKLGRQQDIMIAELNHRVRNILALVKSVSHQSRKPEGSLESYSQALEARIDALATAHDLGAGSRHRNRSPCERLFLSNPNRTARKEKTA